MFFVFILCLLFRLVPILAWNHSRLPRAVPVEQHCTVYTSGWTSASDKSVRQKISQISVCWAWGVLCSLLNWSNRSRWYPRLTPVQTYIWEMYLRNGHHKTLLLLCFPGYYNHCNCSHVAGERMLKAFARGWSLCKRWLIVLHVLHEENGSIYSELYFFTNRGQYFIRFYEQTPLTSED